MPLGSWRASRVATFGERPLSEETSRGWESVGNQSWNDGPAQSGPPWPQSMLRAVTRRLLRLSVCPGLPPQSGGWCWLWVEVSRQAVSADGFSVGDLGEGLLLDLSGSTAARHALSLPGPQSPPPQGEGEGIILKVYLLSDHG